MTLKKKQKNNCVEKWFNKSKDYYWWRCAKQNHKEKTNNWEADWSILEWYHTTPAAYLRNMETWSCMGTNGNGSLVFTDHLSGKCEEQDLANYSPWNIFYLPFMNIYHFPLCILLFSHISINFGHHRTRWEKFLSALMKLTSNWVGWRSRMLTVFTNTVQLRTDHKIIFPQNAESFWNKDCTVQL